LVGIVSGVTIAACLFLTKRDPWFGWSAGFVALCFNFLITVVVSLLARNRQLTQSSDEL
jgi:Na+/proline symporter